MSKNQHRPNKALHPTAYSSVRSSLRFRRRVSWSFACLRAALLHCILAKVAGKVCENMKLKIVVAVLFSTLFSCQMTQAAPVVIGTVDNERMQMFGKVDPALVTKSVKQVIVAKKLSFIVTNQIRWVSPDAKVTDVTKDVLRSLVDAGLVSVEPLTAKHQEAAKSALRALRKLAAAAEVGVAEKDFRERLIDAKAEVSENLQEIPSGILKTEIQIAMDAYTDAASIWNASFEYKYWRVLFVGPPGDIIKKYAIPVSAEEGDLRETTQDDRNLILNVIWAVATKHIDNAAALVAS